MGHKGTIDASISFVAPAPFPLIYHSLLLCYFSIRHDNVCLGINRILTAPQTRYCLLLRVELQARLAVERIRTAACDTLLVAREAKHGKRDGDGSAFPSVNFPLHGARETAYEREYMSKNLHIDTNLAGL